MAKLGEHVTDSITGFSGIVKARTEYLYGCVTCGVSSKELKDGLPMDLQWIDEQQLGPSTATVGGPQNNPPGRSHPTQ